MRSGRNSFVPALAIMSVSVMSIWSSKLSVSTTRCIIAIICRGKDLFHEKILCL